MIGDLANQQAVTQLAEAIQHKVEHIDTLVNAGYLAVSFASQDGMEMHFAVNVFAPRLLTLLLKQQRC